MTESAWSLLQHYHNLELEGVWTREIAQEKAKSKIRSMHYGSEMQQYFWINDYNHLILVHPFLSHLEGTDMSDFEDAEGNRLVVKFVQMAKKYGSGYSEYLWPTPKDPERVTRFDEDVTAVWREVESAEADVALRITAGLLLFARPQIPRHHAPVRTLVRRLRFEMRADEEDRRGSALPTIATAAAGYHRTSARGSRRIAAHRVRAHG